jgi:transcription initiation factor TFIIIB Brf1 subunit/transcription initiation factor TFIIB
MECPKCSKVMTEKSVKDPDTQVQSTEHVCQSCGTVVKHPKDMKVGDKVVV